MQWFLRLTFEFWGNIFKFWLSHAKTVVTLHKALSYHLTWNMSIVVKERCELGFTLFDQGEESLSEMMSRSTHDAFLQFCFSVCWGWGYLVQHESLSELALGAKEKGSFWPLKIEAIWFNMSLCRPFLFTWWHLEHIQLSMFRAISNLTENEAQ